MNHNEQIKELRTMPFGKEFQAYMISLAAATTGKPKPPAAFIRNLERENSTFVTANDIRHVMKEMQAIFAEEGYMPHKELENKLMQKLCPDLPATDLERADEIISGEYKPDHLTGFLQKPLVPLTTAEAWFYAQTTGNPAHILEIDFSNMRGTNEHYERLLQEQNGMAQTGTDISEQAMAMTDKAARRICDTITRTLAQNIDGHGRAHYTALRSGGDEARIILSDVQDEQMATLIEKLHNAIENEVKKLGLQHHPHAKAPDDPVRNGFGAAMAALPLNGIDNMADAIKEADEAIKAAKNKIGQQRLKEQTSASPETIKDKIKHDFSGNDRPASPHVSGISSVFGEHVPDRVLSLEQIREAAFSHLQAQLEQDEKTLSPVAWRLLETKIARYPAIDYASGTLMPRDQPVIVSIFRDILARQQDMAERNDQPVLYGMGMSFHNLSGLNENIGHDAANAYLHYAVHEIIQPAFYKHGIPDTHYTLAHYGGGEFRAVIKDPHHRTGHRLSEEKMHDIAKNIEDRVKDLNNSTLAIFLSRYRISLGQNEEDKIPEKFSDIPNGKPEQRPWNNGLSTTVAPVTIPIYEKDGRNLMRAGAMLHNIGLTLEKESKQRLVAKKEQLFAPITYQSKPIPPDPHSGGGNSR